MEEIEQILIFSFLITLGFAALLYIPALMTRRAVFKVIGTFCRHNAVGWMNAKSVDELGLNPPDLFESLFRFRDYKPYALRALLDAGIVHATPDGRLYLVEEKLAAPLRCKTEFTPPPVQP